MKSSLFSLLIHALIAAVLAVPSPAHAQKTGHPPFKLDVKAAALINVHSGQFVFEQDADEQIPPASLTKLMTLHLALDAVDNGYVTLEDRIPVSKKAWKTGGSKMFLRVDTEVSMEKLLTGIAVVSGNDACVAVAEYIAGVEDVFVQKMNAKAAAIGLAKTLFRNSHGLPQEGQLTTAHDMALLAYDYMKSHPEALKYHGIKEMTFNKITQRNRNGLLWLDYGIDGLKTGWFSRAGYHIIATASRSGDRFIAVVMGDKSEAQRENTALKMLNYGFRNFKTIRIPDEKTGARVSVWKGSAGEVALGTSRDLYITLPLDSQGEMYVEKDIPQRIFAPVEKNQDVGKLRIVFENRVVKSVPLVTREPVARAGFAKRTIHALLLSFVLPPYWGAVIVLLVFVALVLCMVLDLRKSKKRKDDISNLDSLIH